MREPRISDMRPTAARRGEVTLESTASELLAAIINIVQNKWNVDDVDPDLFLGPGKLGGSCA